MAPHRFHHHPSGHRRHTRSDDMKHVTRKTPLVISKEKRKRARLVFDWSESPGSSKRSRQSPHNSQTERDNRSPEPNCPICLGKVEDKCFAHGCFHSFCRTCLSEWAKVKAECPVCRDPFDKILFNVKALDVYDEVVIPPRPAPSAGLFGHMGVSTLADLFFSETGMAHYLPFMPQVHRYSSSATATQSSAAGVSPSYTPSSPAYAPVSPGFSMSSVSIQIGSSGPSSSIVVRSGHPSSRSSATSSYSRLEDYFFPAMRVSARARPGTQEFRSHIYRSDLWVKFPFPDNRQRRITSSEWYRNNPAASFRLHEFIARDLRAILRTRHEVTLVQNLVVAALVRDDIRSRAFRRVIEAHTLSQTDHFIHELFCFASSPIENCLNYDAQVVYVSRSQTQVQTTTPSVPPLGYMYELDEEQTVGLRSTPECIELSSDSSDDEDDEGYEAALRAGQRLERDMDRIFAPPISPPASQTNSHISTSATVGSEAAAESRGPSPHESDDDVVELVDVEDGVDQVTAVFLEAETQDPDETQVDVINVNIVEDFDNPQPGPSGVNTRLFMPMNLTTNDYDSDSDVDVGLDFPPVRFYRRPSPAQETEPEDLKVDDVDDEVEVVGSVKARHERTYEVFDLSDDDGEDRQVTSIERCTTTVKEEIPYQRLSEADPTEEEPDAERKA